MKIDFFKREKIKTVIILVLLVLLFVNTYIFISSHYRESWTDENVMMFKSDMGFALSPCSVELIDYSGERLMLYSPGYRTFEKFILHTAQILKEEHEIKTLDITDIESLPGIKMNFNLKCTADDFVNVFCDFYPENLGIGYIDSIYIREGKLGSPIIVSGDSVFEIIPKFPKDKYEYISYNLSETLMVNFEKTSIRYGEIKIGNIDLTVPVSGYLSPKIYSIEPEYNVDSLNKKGDIVNKVFGLGAQFVKEGVTSDGDVLYVYGYGEESLKITREGALEYKRPSKNITGIGDLKADLSTALAFNENLTGETSNLVLIKNQVVNDGESSVRRLYFQKTYIGKKVNIIPDKIYMRVDVSGGQVLYYYRYFPTLNTFQSNKRYAGKRYNQDTMSAVLSSELSDLESAKNFEFVNYIDDTGKLMPAYGILFDGGVSILDFYTELFVGRFER